MRPAKMAPIMPPTSNSVLRSALSSAEKSVDSLMYFGSQKRNVYDTSFAKNSDSENSITP